MQNQPKVRISQDPPEELVESPRPLGPQRTDSTLSQASITDTHPALRANVINVPVTPGINLSTYRPTSQTVRGASSYFSTNLNTLPEDMSHSGADSSSDALAGASSGQEILRRMSMSGSGERRDSVASIDALAANPELALSGSVISATFCLPHSAYHRKGSDWVSHMLYCLVQQLTPYRNSLDVVVLQPSSMPLPICLLIRHNGTIHSSAGQERSNQLTTSYPPQTPLLLLQLLSSFRLLTNLQRRYLWMPMPDLQLHQKPTANGSASKIKNAWRDN